MAEGRKDKDEWFIGNGAKLVGWFQPQKKKNWFDKYRSLLSGPS